MDPVVRAFSHQEAFTAKTRSAPMFHLLRAKEAPSSAPFIARRKILVIEDNKDSAESLRMILSMLGYDASVAHCGVEGVHQARTLMPDAIVCDIGLPGMDGYEVARTLRQEPATSLIPLIALTAYGHEDDRARALKNGFTHYLVKPADPVELLRLLGELDSAPPD